MPGFREHIGLVVEHRDDGRVVVCVDAEETHLNPAGTLHGGLIATMCDIAMGEAVYTKKDDAEVPVTVEMKVNYLSPGAPGAIHATAHVRKVGRRFTVVEAEVTDSDEQVLAVATATFTTVGG